MAVQHKNGRFVAVDVDYEQMGGSKPSYKTNLSFCECCEQLCAVSLVLIVTLVLASPDIFALIAGYHPNAFGGDSDTNWECIQMTPDGYSQNTKQILVIGGWVSFWACIFMSIVVCFAVGSNDWSCASIIMWLIITIVEIFWVWWAWNGFNIHSSLPNYCQHTPAVKMLLAWEILKCIYFCILCCIGCAMRAGS